MERHKCAECTIIWKDVQKQFFGVCMWFESILYISHTWHKKLFESCVFVSGLEVSWVQCDRCEEWFHMICIGVAEDEISENEDYICFQCKNPQVSRTAALQPPQNPEDNISHFGRLSITPPPPPSSRQQQQLYSHPTILPTSQRDRSSYMQEVLSMPGKNGGDMLGPVVGGDEEDGYEFDDDDEVDYVHYTQQQQQQRGGVSRSVNSMYSSTTPSLYSAGEGGGGGDAMSGVKELIQQTQHQQQHIVWQVCHTLVRTVVIIVYISHRKYYTPCCYISLLDSLCCIILFLLSKKSGFFLIAVVSKIFEKRMLPCSMSLFLVYWAYCSKFIHVCPMKITSKAEFLVFYFFFVCLFKLFFFFLLVCN